MALPNSLFISLQTIEPSIYSQNLKNHSLQFLKQICLINSDDNLKPQVLVIISMLSIFINNTSISDENLEILFNILQILTFKFPEQWESQQSFIIKLFKMYGQVKFCLYSEIQFTFKVIVVFTCQFL